MLEVGEHANVGIEPAKRSVTRCLIGVRRRAAVSVLRTLGRIIRLPARSHE